MAEMPTPNSPPSRHGLVRGMSSPTGWGFALLLVLMTTLMGHAIWQINDLETRMREIVTSLNLKIQLATDLQEAAFNRHVALIYQTLATDPFERDDNYQLYIKWGYHVGKARNDLKALTLDSLEQDNLARQDALIARIVLLHEEIAELAAAGRSPEAHILMADELRPLNLEFTETVEQLRRHARDRVQAALQATQAASRQAVQLHVLLGALVLGLALLISLTTRRLLAQHAQRIWEELAELERTGTELEHAATHDPLTGLANRALFERRLEEELGHARQEGFHMAILYLDLDDFKLVNDTHGHAVGDALLIEIAHRLRGVVRASDTVARLGGDEFAIILSGLASAGQCVDIKKKLVEEIARPARLEDLELTSGGSVGCVLYPQDGKTVAALVKAADERMYSVKRARKESRARQTRA
jgi:diguanylate cyclase (GGDEF)-like protein